MLSEKQIFELATLQDLNLLEELSESDFELLKWHGTLPLLSEKVKSLNLPIFQKTFLEQNAKFLIYKKQLKSIEDDFAECGLKPILLKGVTCLVDSSYFPNPKMRQMVDFDFWLKGSDFDIFLEFANKKGFVLKEKFSENGKITKATFHKKGDLLTIEIHRDLLTNSFQNYFDEEDAFNSARLTENSKIFRILTREWHIILRLAHDTLANHYLLKLRAVYLLEIYWNLKNLDGNYSQLNSIVKDKKLKKLFGFYCGLAIRNYGNDFALPFEKSQEEFQFEVGQWQKFQSRNQNYYHAESRFFRISLNVNIVNKIQDIFRILWLENTWHYSTNFLIQEYKIKNPLFKIPVFLKAFHFLKLALLFLKTSITS
ncbi:MAG: hypothetical protein DWQ06_10935 [Calditrichaeota bacterium]|nr:MAG: hypothetical protein DWQ06_10935 [Calditrichota bacterium]